MRELRQLAAIAVLSLVIAVARGADPIARHFVVVANEAGEVTLPLAGFDADGDPMSCTIVSLPATGTLTQLSQVFSDYGYEPRRGATIAAVPARVSGSGNRVNFHAPSLFDPTAMGPWATFEYTVTAGGATSPPGRVWVLRASDPAAIVVSDFRGDAEGWATTQRERSGVAPGATGGAQHAPEAPVVYDPSRRGRLSRFVHAEDGEVNVVSAEGPDADLWYFIAPEKFHGNHVAAYHGAIEFTLTSAAGDFAHLHTDAAAVVLECASCNLHRGRRLLYPLSAMKGYDGREREVSIPLTSSAGWIVDPENEAVNTRPGPTSCELAEVLEGISALKILGDFTPGWEAVALDNVRFTRGSVPLPIECYASLR